VLDCFERFLAQPLSLSVLPSLLNLDVEDHADSREPRELDVVEDVDGRDDGLAVAAVVDDEEEGEEEEGEEGKAEPWKASAFESVAVVAAALDAFADDVGPRPVASDEDPWAP